MKVINKDSIAEVLDFLAEKYRLFAPKEAEDFIVNFALMAPGDQVKLDFYNSKDPPKRIFLPQAEVLFSYSKDGQQNVPDPEKETPAVVFGMRPCDARSLALLDMVFDTKDYQDPYYVARRKNTTIFVMACTSPQRSCFCTSFDFGPFSSDEADVLVVDADDKHKYLFEAITEKGKKILSELPGLSDADEADVGRVEQLKAQAQAKVTRNVDLDGLPEKLATMEEHPIWQEISQQCLSCGVCGFACPTCHCFDIVDEPGKEGGKRMRIWDTCMSPNFTREASGHDPRASSASHMRQRIMHKFNYFVVNNGVFSCVGCGRCIRSCPPSVNLTKNIERIQQAPRENPDE